MRRTPFPPQLRCRRRMRPATVPLRCSTFHVPLLLAGGSAPGVPPQDGLRGSGGGRAHPSRAYQFPRESLRGLHSPAACRVRRPSAAFAARPSDGRGSLRARRNSCSVRCDGPARPSGLVRPRTSRIVTVMSPSRETCSPGATGSESVTVIRHLQMLRLLDAKPQTRLGLLLSTRNSAWRPFRAQPGAAPGVAPHQGHPRVTRE
ncbi:unannotated protein [freshwater metagenome]|uniref:Unannotated protein n=1 Tax=freshwater metagenome TaxID=449393 RepID=A0A6J6TU26_9ZZZZ